MARLHVVLVACAVLLAGGIAGAGEDDRIAALLKQMKDREGGVRLAAVREAAKLTDPALTAPLLKLLKDSEALVREAAIDALRVRESPDCRKKAAQALAVLLPALAKDVARGDEYRLAISALHDLARPESIDTLLDLDVDEDRETSRARLFAVANVPSPEAIDELIKFLSKGRNKGRNHQKELCREALRFATGENLGADPDKWRAWWKTAKATFDFEAAAARRAAEEERRRKKEEQREERDRKRREKKEKKDDQAPEGGS